MGSQSLSLGSAQTAVPEGAESLLPSRDQAVLAKPVPPVTADLSELSGVMREWWSEAGLNCRHMDFQSTALPTELSDHELKNIITERKTSP